MRATSALHPGSCHSVVAEAWGGCDYTQLGPPGVHHIGRPLEEKPSSTDPDEVVDLSVH